jgi:hypothetical protein
LTQTVAYDTELPAALSTEIDVTDADTGDG